MGSSKIRAVVLSGISLAALSASACNSAVEKAPAAERAPVPGRTEAAPARKFKAVEVEGVISGVGQRTITFQVEAKGKIRKEVVGVNDKTRIEKGGSNIKLRDLRVADRAWINYEPGAYSSALAIRVTGVGEVKKVGGD